MSANRILIAACGLLIMISGCTWVKPSQEAENVKVMNADDVANCKKVARTTHSVKADVFGVERKNEKVQTELETLARNAAPEYGGNVVVPDTEIEDGKQSFNVYKCD